MVRISVMMTLQILPTPITHLLMRLVRRLLNLVERMNINICWKTLRIRVSTTVEEATITAVEAIIIVVTIILAVKAVGTTVGSISPPTPPLTTAKIIQIITRIIMLSISIIPHSNNRRLPKSPPPPFFGSFGHPSPTNSSLISSIISC